MHPGRIGLDCHMQAPQPFIKNRFQIAGTVYPTGHEPDDCNSFHTQDDTNNVAP